MKTLVIVLLVAGFLAGCASVFGPGQDQQGQNDGQTQTQPAPEPVDYPAVLRDAIGSGFKTAVDQLKETPAGQAGGEIAGGIYKLLVALGVIGTTTQTIRQTQASKKAIEANTKANQLSAGLQFIEDAIIKAGDAGKAVTGKIKEEGGYAVNAVDKARAVANGT